MSKICSKCGHLRKDADYRDNRTVCKKCRSEQDKELQRATKAKCVEYLGGKCAICGYAAYNGCLEFHHRNPASKEFTIGEKNYSFNARVRKELDKCTLVCRNCHGEIHGDAIPRRRFCKVCGEPFTSRDILAKYCSPDCVHVSQRRFSVYPEVLAKLVWEKPLTKIAEDFGVSDKAIAKMCKKYQIKTPGKGYWSGKRREP